MESSYYSAIKKRFRNCSTISDKNIFILSIDFSESRSSVLLFFFFKIFLYAKKIHFEIKDPQVCKINTNVTTNSIIRRKEKSINPKIFPIKGER